MSADATPEPLRPVFSRNPLSWLVLFGPGAIVASLTIGTGELIFSSRGGAIFGHRILFVFATIAILKWALVFSTARHMVLSGAHPFERWMRLPGPRGWLPTTFVVLAVLSVPIWIGFHSTVLGNFLAQRTGTHEALAGGAQYLWGLGVLATVLVVVFAGGYSVLERVQLVIVVAMLISVTAALIALGPDWGSLASGLFVPQPLAYPDWLATEYPQIAARPVWIETTLYVGVVGGASYDYLAYVSFLREKNWGGSSCGIATGEQLEAIARDPRHPRRQWLRAPLVDSVLSFAAVIAFSAVFVAAGRLLLGSKEIVPTGDDFLGPQASFVESLDSRLVPLYFCGAFLTLLGTLYGTIEVAPTIVREFATAVRPTTSPTQKRRLRRRVVGAFGGIAAALLFAQFLGAWVFEARLSPTDLLAPANLFTGVLSCGFVCFLSVWADVRFLPRGLRMSWWLVLLNVAAGTAFLLLGLKGYWDFGTESIGEGLGGAVAIGILLATLSAGALIAAVTLARVSRTTP